jgi:hypothetical protein
VYEEDKLSFAVARPRDHLWCPFRFELCQFWNIQGRSPQVGSGLLDDTKLMKCLRREPMPVSQSLGKVNRALQIAHELGMSNPYLYKLGPWKLEDYFGVGAAAIMEKRPMDPGVTKSTVQFERVRKMKSTFVNL